MTSAPYIQESDYQHMMAEQVASLWHKRLSGKTTTVTGHQIHWCSLTSSAHEKAILVLNGRVETVAKYQELFYDLFQQGYDIYSYDHRGQGLSDRLVSGSDIGHIEQFSDYVSDLQHMVELFALDKYTKRFLLAHSMGGAIGLRYLEGNPNHPFTACALSAPMLGLPVPAHLRPFAIPYTYLLSRLSKEPNYAPGYGPYKAKPFENNPLTHSQVRYQWFRQLYDTYPEFKTGGPSSHWVLQSLIALRHLHRDQHKLTIPLLILQAENDQIVANQAQTHFVQQAASSTNQLTVLKGASHELLFECDLIRNQVLTQLLQFYADH